MTFTMFLALLPVVLLLAFLGGMGGQWTSQRVLSRRIDILAEDVDGLYSLYRKRAGREAVDKRERGKRDEEDSIEELKLRAAAEQASRGRRTPAVAAVPSDVDAERVFAGGARQSIRVGE